MKIFRLFLILRVKFVVTIVAYYRQCYESYSLCLITNIDYVDDQYCWNSKCRLNQSSAADWCKEKSSSLAIITNGTVQAAVKAFIDDPHSKLTSDIITYGYRFPLPSWEWINGNRSVIYPSYYLNNGYRYAYLYVSEDRLAVAFNGLPTSRRKFICSYNLNNDTTCSYGYQLLKLTCYKMRHENVTWYDARNLCRQERNDLAVFENELPPLTLEWELTEQYWIGLRKESWNWKDAYAKVKYSKWNDRSPSSAGGNCLCLQVPSGKWKECYCNRNYRYICMQAYSSNSSSSTKTSTTRPSIILITLPTTMIKIPTMKTKLNTPTKTPTIIFTQTVADPRSQFHSTLAPSDDLSYKASGEPENLSESGQNSGLILALGIGSACLLLLIGLIIVIVVIKNRRSRSGGVGPRQQDYPPQHIYETGVPNNVYAMVVPNTNESARSASDRTQSEIVYAELDLAPTEKMIQRASTPGKTPNQIVHGPAPKGNKRGRSAAPESEYANSIPLESVYDNIAPS